MPMYQINIDVHKVSDGSRHPYMNVIIAPIPRSPLPDMLHMRVRLSAW